MSNPWRIRWTILEPGSFQRDIRDCNIICLTETWLTPSVPDTAVTPSDNFSVLRMDRTAEAGKSKGGGVCFMTNKKWCDPRNISSLSRSCSPHLEHLSIICAHSIYPASSPRSSLLLLTFHLRQALVLPLGSYAGRQLLMTSTGTCSNPLRR